MNTMEFKLEATDKSCITYKHTDAMFESKAIASDFVHAMGEPCEDSFCWGKDSAETNLLAKAIMFIVARELDCCSTIEQLVIYTVNPMYGYFAKTCLHKLPKRESHSLVVDIGLWKSHGERYCSVIIPSKV